VAETPEAQEIRKQADAAWERGDKDEAARLHNKAAKVNEQTTPRQEVFIEIRKDESAADAARRTAIDAIYTARDADKNMHEAGEAAADAVLRIVAMASRTDVSHNHIFIPTHWDSAGREWAYRCSCGDWARGPEREHISELESRHLMDVRAA
jgi:isocitrate dehydrogenase kinase/phosphatase